TRGLPITQLPLRIIGAAMVVAVVDTLFNMIGATRPDECGMLGIALGNLVEYYFKHGSWLIVLMTLVVGALLVADEIILALPARLLWLRKRIPAEQIAGGMSNAATGAAGGIWSGVKS